MCLPDTSARMQASSPGVFHAPNRPRIALDRQSVVGRMVAVGNLMRSNVIEPAMTERGRGQSRSVLFRSRSSPIPQRGRP